MLTRARYRRALAMLVAALPLAGLAAAGIGAYYIPPWDIPRVLATRSMDEGFHVLAFIRFPRVLLAALVGAALSTSGACLQGLFRNPLADPGLIGVTSGSALGAALWIVLIGSSPLGPWGLPMAAFIAGAAAVVLVYRIAHGAGGLVTNTMLLAGIAVNSIAGAAIGMLSFYADEQELRSLTFWQLGAFGYATWSAVLTTALCTALGLAVLMSTGKALNALALGEAQAFHVGVATTAIKRRIVFGCALSVGAGVAAAGSIGFVGLVVPHLLRLCMGADHRWLLPASALGGAMLLVMADLAARTVVMPAEMPVGVLTALGGGPFFLWLILRHKRTVAHA
jgi:iron complex transport system permease protein